MSGSALGRSGGGLGGRLDERTLVQPIVVALVALAWLALWWWERSPYGRYLDHDALEAVGPDPALALVFVAGWVLMTVAMMLPTTLPLVRLFTLVVRGRADGARLIALLVVGYLAVWTAFGVAAHVGDWAVHALVDRVAWLDRREALVGAAVLLVAGAYQLSSLKYRCLDQCRAPRSLITRHWRGGDERRQALRLGAHHGVLCVGCCWALMLLMFAVGVGNVAWMLVLGAAMAVEKNLPRGRELATPLGVALLVAGALPFAAAALA